MSKYILSLLSRYGLSPDISLDQNFFTNLPMLNKIISYANLTKNDVVLEVGTGLGFLTKNLAKKAGKVISYEIDKRFMVLLERELVTVNNIELYFENILTVKLPFFNKIVSSLPYNICEPLLIKLRDYAFDLAVFVVPRSFSLKMVGDSGVARLCNKWAVELLDDIPPECFFPRPKVTSRIVRLKPKQLK